MLQSNVAKIVVVILVSTLVIVFSYHLLNSGKNSIPITLVSPLTDNAFSVEPKTTNVLGTDSSETTQVETPKPSASVAPDRKVLGNKKETTLGGNNPIPVSQTTNVQVQVSAQQTPQEPDPTPKASTPVVIPEYMTAFEPGAKFDWQKGRIKFHFKADWGEGEARDFLYLNYNGTNRKNLFYVGVLDNVLTFDTYTNDTTSDYDETNADLGPDFPGKEFDIELVWDFTVASPFKKLYINGRLESEQSVVFRPSDANPKAYVGPVSNVLIAKE